MSAASSELAARMTQASRFIAWSTIFIGASTLLGWITGSIALQTWLISPITMKAITALCFVIAGVALLLLLPGERGWRAWTGQGLAVAIAALAWLSVVQYVLDVSLGIDSFLIQERLGPFSGPYPGRMASITAVGFLCLGGALFGMRPGGWRWAPRSLLAILTGLTGIMGLHGILVAPGTVHFGTATHTALAFLLMGFGTLFARPQEGVVRLWTAPGTSGVLARQLLPMAIVVPWMLTVVSKTGEKYNWLDPVVWTSVMVVVRILALCAIVLWALRSAQQLEAEREVAELGIRRANRALQALSEANEAVVRAGSEQELLDSVCRTVVEVGGYKLAWVGVPENDQAKSVRPVACHGTGTDYVHSAQISWADVPRGRGPTGTAIRSGQMQVARSLRTDPSFGPWREAALAHGLGSSIVFPLRGDDHILAALNIYAAEPDAFDAQEVDLLGRLAANLAFGITAMRVGQEREQAQTSLQQSEERYRTLVVATSQMVWSTGPSGLVEPPFPDWQKFTGQSDEEVAGWGWAQALHPDDAERTKDIWRQALEARRLYDTEYRARRRDGEYRHLRARGVPVLAEDGAIREWIGTCHDITEQRELEEGLRESQAYNRGLLESSIDGLVTVDRALVVSDVNQMMCRMAGKPREEIIGSLFPAYFTEAARAEQGVRQTFEQGAVTDYILTLRGDGGREIPVSFNAAVFRDAAGEVQGIFAAARDITERRRAEENLERYAEQLKRSNQELEDFATVASHDLQEPLRKIGAFGERLSQRCCHCVDPQAQDYLSRMMNAGRRMSELINSLLEFSRITRKGGKFEPTDLNVVAAEVLADLESRIQESGAEVTIGPLPTLLADPVQMRQLLQNLISNALKFRKVGTDHHVAVGSGTEDNGFWEIHVTDNGIGFEERFLDRIFKPFQRLHGRGEYEGHGMGLAVCDKIVRRHGGRLTACSQPGQGSDFIVLLPRLPSEERPWTSDGKRESGKTSSFSWPKTMTTTLR